MTSGIRIRSYNYIFKDLPEIYFLRNISFIIYAFFPVGYFFGDDCLEINITVTSLIPVIWFKALANLLLWYYYVFVQLFFIKYLLCIRHYSKQWKCNFLLNKTQFQVPYSFWSQIGYVVKRWYCWKECWFYVSKEIYVSRDPS